MLNMHLLKDPHPRKKKICYFSVLPPKFGFPRKHTESLKEFCKISMSNTSQKNVKMIIIWEMKRKKQAS